jgi:predicted nucleic acid-binding protein
MKVTLDTNILVQDFWFDSPHSKVFLDELNIIPATLHIPEIVIDETVNKYREFLTEKVTELKKANSDVSRMLKKEIANTPINIDQAIKDYEKFLTDRLKELKAQILPYPKVEHKEVVKQILERRRPFKKGDAGYRDFLIWQTIKKLEAWGTEEIVFLTKNTKDFGESGFLSVEFTDKTTGNKNFKISVAVSKFNDEYILPRLKKLDELKLQLAKGQVQNFNFKKWLDTDFVKFLKEGEFEEVLTGFPYGVGRVRITEIIFYDDFKVVDASQLESGEKLVKFSLKCKVNASVDIDWDDYLQHKEVREYYGEAVEEFGSSYGMTSEKIEVEGYLILDKQNEEVNSVEITMVEGPHGNIEMGI